MINITQEQVLAALASSVMGNLGSGQKADGAGLAGPLYGAGGLFGNTEANGVLVNALVAPRGVESILTWVGTSEENKFTETLSGVLLTGSNQSTACGDCRVVGEKACTQFYPIGRFCAQTPEFQFDNIGMRAHSGVPIRALFGNITDAVGNTIVAQGQPITDKFFLDSQLVGYALRFLLGDMIYNGDLANNAGAYKEFKGLDIIVNDGKIDALTDLRCAAADSFLMDLNSATWTADGTTAVRAWFARMIQEFQYRAEGAGFDWDSAQLHIVMSPNMWDQVSRVFSCAGVDLCGTPAAFTMNTSQDLAMSRYEEYITRRALPILGKWYPVVIDNMIDETDDGTGWVSDIYFLTTQIAGRDVLWGEYQDFNATYGDAAAEIRSLFGSDDIATTDGGRFAMIRDNSRGCFDIQGLLKPRLVGIAPWLSGRIQNARAVLTNDQNFPGASGTGDATALDCGRTTTPLTYLYDNNTFDGGGFFQP